MTELRLTPTVDTLTENPGRLAGASLEARTAEIKARQHQEIIDRQDMIVSSTSMRTLIGNLADARGIRLGPGALDYATLAGMRPIFRAVADFRTNPDGSLAERNDPQVGKRMQLFNEQLSPELDDSVQTVAQEMGLKGNILPQVRESKLVIILGGGPKALKERQEFPERLRRKGLLESDSTAIMASERLLSNSEIAVAKTLFGREPRTEFEAAICGAEALHGVEFTKDDMVTWEHRTTDHPRIGKELTKFKMAYLPSTKDHSEISVVSSGIMTRHYTEAQRRSEAGAVLEFIAKARNRANTSDTLATLEKLRLAIPGDLVTVVTNTRFAGFQGTDTQKILGDRGIDSQLACFDPEEFGHPPLDSATLLQEMLSMVDSLYKAA